MKYLKKFNEELSSEDYFPNAEEAVKRIDFYLSQWEDYGFDIEKIPGWGGTWNIDNCNNIKYYYRIFPNEMPPPTQLYIKNFTPRIDCHITTKIENVETLRELYNQLKFLPSSLFQDDLYARIYFNDGNDILTHPVQGLFRSNGVKDKNCFINLTVYSTQEDLDDANQKISFNKNWSDVKKRQENQK